MKTVFSYLALSGILIGAAVTIAEQTGPNRQAPRKERTQALIVDKRDGARNGNSNPGKSARNR
jgi:hypothetical protein